LRDYSGIVACWRLVLSVGVPAVPIIPKECNKMKVIIRIAVFMLVSLPLYAKSVPGSVPTEEQVTKLAAAAWKEPVHTIDVTLYKDVTKPPKSVEELRQMFEDAFNKGKGRPKENLSPAELEMRNRDIQLNVEREVNAQEVGRKIKERIRISGHRQRIDQVLGWPKMVLLQGTPYEEVRPEVVLGPNTPYEMTYVNLGDKRKGDYTSFAYYHANKTARITNNRNSMWAQSDIIGMLAPPGIFITFQRQIGVNKGTTSQPIFVPDPNKIQKITSTGILAGNRRLTIGPDPNNPDSRDRIEIKDPNSPGGIVLICERKDYSRVYYSDIRNPLTGKLLVTKECSNFDAQGFPHNATVIKFDMDGNLKEKEVYTIEKVELNPDIPDEVFEFRPPEGYDVVNLRPGSGYDEKVKRESEALTRLQKLHEVSDIPELRKLLKHESWKVRLIALKTIGGLPIKDPAVLKDIAASMQNDENPDVHKEADRILRRIELNK